MVALSIVFAIIAVTLVVFSEVLDFIGPHAVGDHWPILRAFQLSRPVRAAALCAAVGMFLYSYYGEPLQEAVAQTEHFFGGQGITVHFSPGDGPAPLSAKVSTGAVPGKASSPKLPSGYSNGITLLVTGEEHASAKPLAHTKAEPESCDGSNGASQAEEAAFDKMVALYNARRYSELLPVCTEQMRTNPAWPTPYLFCGLAQLGENNISAAAQMKRQFQSVSKGSAEATQGACRQANDFLMTHLPR